MITRARLSSSCVVAVVCLSATTSAMQAPAPSRPPDFDIRDRRMQTADSARAAQAARELRSRRPNVVVRYDGRKGVRTFDAPGQGISGPDRRTGVEIAHAFLWSTDGALFDLDRDDLATLQPKHVFESSKGRVVTFRQSVDGVPVFDAAVTVHVGPDGRIVRLVSSAVSVRHRLRGGIVDAAEAVRLAAGNVRAQLDTFRPLVVEREHGPEQRTRMARGPLAGEPVASMVYFPMDGRLRSAWHVVVQPEGAPHAYEIIVDAPTGRILLRRGQAQTPALRRAALTQE